MGPGTCPAPLRHSASHSHLSLLSILADAPLPPLIPVLARGHQLLNENR